MWVIKRDVGSAAYFGAYEWEREQRNAVRFASRRLAKENAGYAAETNSGVRVVRLVRKASQRKAWGVVERWMVKHGLGDHVGTIAHEELANRIARHNKGCDAKPGAGEEMSDA